MSKVSKPPITWAPAHPDNYSTGHSSHWEAIVLHIMDGSMVGTIDWFSKNAAMRGPGYGNSSTHYGISREGRIYQFVSLGNVAFAHGVSEWLGDWHLGHQNHILGVSPNAFAVGIEHEGKPFESGKHFKMSPAMWKASTHLSAWLWQDQIEPHKDATGAVLDAEHIVGHYRIDPRNRANCPNLSPEDWGRYIQEVKNLLTETVVVPPPPVELKLKEELEGMRKYVEDTHTLFTGEMDNLLTAVEDVKTVVASLEEQLAKRRLYALGTIEEKLKSLK
jgi:hypothetical protein